MSATGKGQRRGRPPKDNTLGRPLNVRLDEGTSSDLAQLVAAMPESLRNASAVVRSLITFAAEKLRGGPRP